MKHGRRFTAVACVLAVFLCLPGASRAAVDLTGQWLIDGVTIGDFFPGFPVTCLGMTVVQSGTALSATGTCSLIGAVSLSGTIDPGTGAFTLTGTPATLCDSVTMTATASADSYAFSGSFSCLFGTLPIPGTLTGSRCGNGVLDPSEQCDHALPGDCCNPTTCQFESAGTACAPDGTICTDDVCDGAGLCQHLSNTAPCDDGNQCTTDQCAGGACVGTPKATGTACDDGDSCTTADACDASGTCLGGPALVCDPPCGTGVCDPAFGCVADVGSCDDPTGPGGTLLLVDRTPNTKDRLAWTWSKGPAIAPGDLGDPLNDTTYTLCVSDYLYSNTGVVVRLRDAMTAPAGTRWFPKSKGFRYADKTGTPNGLRTITLVSGDTGKARIKVKGAGPNLLRPVPATLLFQLGSAPLVQLKASNGRCWDTPELVLTYGNNGKLKAKGSPSGAFLE
jgi:hypothetical protein